MKSVRAKPEVLALYALRDSLTLYELACLAHGAEPERVSDRAWRDVRTHWRAAHGTDARPSPGDVLGLIDAAPEVILGPEIGATLKALRTATARPVNAAVPLAHARRLLAALGRDLPAELGHAETVAERQARRLARLRALGADMRSAAAGWQCVGSRGALAALVREESSAGGPRSDRSDVRRDLIDAAQAHRGS